MRSRRDAFACGLAIFAAALLAVPDCQASFALVNLGTNTYAVDEGATSASYSQTTNALIFNSTYVLGDTVGGTFSERDWSPYATFGLRMSLTGTNSNLPFTVSFYDANLDIINSYQGSTAGLGTEPTVAMLALSLSGTENFSRVAGMQFTWDSIGAINTAITDVVGFTAPTSGFFVARAPGGAKFLTGTNIVAPFETTLAAGATNWTPATFAMTTLSPGGASWAMLSDSNAKTDIAEINHRETLGKVAALPVSAWQYRNDPTRRYLGPMAQDFHAAFGLGADDRRINTIDTDGVALSALKGLIEELEERKERSAAQARRLADLQAELEALREQVRSQLPPVE